MNDDPTNPIAVPTALQLRHHAREFYGFVHFSINTFTDKEWGFGDEPADAFNPTDFDASQIADCARLAGMRGLILTCKHHDGFCLWPSAFTTHSVARSPFRGGRGDVVDELARACRSAGLEFGVYLSPWDRNYADYGRPSYVTYYRNQLRELLTGYGEIFEVWFDGANGGDGFYGGARERRQIDNQTYYDWENTWQIVRELQPQAVMFSDAGPDVRWIGNEAGIAGDPCWCTVDPRDTWPGHADAKRLNTGDRDGSVWRVPECDVSIRPGWFYHQAEDALVRTPENLVDLYFKSVGRGATFLLNLPPDRRGRIPEVDRANLQAFRSHLNATFGVDVAAGSRINRTPDTVSLEFVGPQRFNVVELRERIALGQRVESWTLEVDESGSGQWREVASAQAIGHRRLVRFGAVTARAARLRVTETRGEPLIDHVGLFLEPNLTPTTPAEVFARTHTPLRVEQPSADELVFDLGEPVSLKGVRYIPGAEHRVSHYAIAFATTVGEWEVEERTGEFGNVRHNLAPHSVSAGDVTARWVRFRALRFEMGSRLDATDVQIF